MLYNKLPKKPFKPLKKFSRAMSDPDRDGYPSAIDCQPHNRNKQGIKEIYQAAKGKYQEWKAKAPERREARIQSRKERHEERMQKLQQRKETAAERLELQKIRGEEQKSRMGVQREQMAIGQQRQRMFEQRVRTSPTLGVPSISGFGTGFIGAATKGGFPKMSVSTPAPMNLFKQQETKAPTKKRVKRRKKGKKKRKVMYVYE
jgi:hypothetical protein